MAKPPFSTPLSLHFTHPAISLGLVECTASAFGQLPPGATMQNARIVWLSTGTLHYQAFVACVLRKSFFSSPSRFLAPFTLAPLLRGSQ